MKQIYLDNQATTPVDPKVFSAMEPWLKDKFGNAASRNHPYGWEAEEAVEISRESVAAIIGALPKEIIFTSGATEANNLALQGVSKSYHEKGKHIITVKTEHKAILDVCDHLEKEGFEITRLPVQADGLLDMNKFEDSIRSNTILVSVMHANNEIGVLQPIKEIGNLCKKYNSIFHSDVAQSIGTQMIDIQDLNIDALSLSAHKIYGPKGIGALFVDAGTKGLVLSPPENKMGWKGSDTRSVYFEDMFIPKENILGNPSKGFKQFLKTLSTVLTKP